MKPSNPIRIINPSIDDYENTVVIRGVIDNDSLGDLKIDYYQRELLPSKSRREIARGLQNGERLPDIVLGMRGETFSVDNGVLNLHDDVFIIDGRQRRDTILEYFCKETLAKTPRLGATIHLNTTVDWERQEFHKLNQFQSKVSPNILLRNNKEDHMAVTTLYGLTKSDKNFVMYDKICWQQNMAKGELITANSMLTVMLMMHSHLQGYPGSGLSSTVPASDRLIGKVGIPIFRDNVKSFFNLLDESFGIRRVTYKGGASYLKLGFMQVLSRLLSDHQVFWKQPDDRRLVVPYELKRKLAKFPITDPEIMRLSSASGASRYTLYLHILNHLNSGKRTGRIVGRNQVVTFSADADAVGIDDVEEDRETA